MADFMGMGQKIQSGDYELSRAMSATEILDQLISGDGKPLTTTITIIPGWTVEDVALSLIHICIRSADDGLCADRRIRSDDGGLCADRRIRSADVYKRQRLNRVEPRPCRL